MRSCLVFLLSLVGSATAGAQPKVAPEREAARGRIHGRVRDTEVQPVAGARVVLAGGPAGGSRATYAARDGRFTFLSVDPGRYVLLAQRLGYTPSSPDTVVIAADETVERDLLLREVIVPLAHISNVLRALRRALTTLDRIRRMERMRRIWSAFQIHQAVALWVGAEAGGGGLFRGYVRTHESQNARARLANHRT